MTTEAAVAETTEFPTWFLAAGANYWGRGHSIKEAIAAMPRKIPAAQRQLFRLPVGADKPFVDEMGYIRWTWLPGAPDKDADLVEVTIHGNPK